jgi:putative restriction endonuclease
VDHLVNVFDHEGPWTEAAYLALQHDGRVEVVDGTLLIGPGAGPRRVHAIEHVRVAVAAALPDGLRVRGPVPIRLGPDCVLVPDLVVTAAPIAPAADEEESDSETDHDADDEGDEADEEAVLDSAEALMVIEVVGSDHGAVDRRFKSQLYARSRIPYSLLIDHDGPFAVSEMIIGGRYHEYAHAGGDERLLIEEPFRLELDLSAIAAPEPPASSAEPPAASADPPAEVPETRALPVVPSEEPGDPARSVKA